MMSFKLNFCLLLLFLGAVYIDGLGRRRRRRKRSNFRDDGLLSKDYVYQVGENDAARQRNDYIDHVDENDEALKIGENWHTALGNSVSVTSRSAATSKLPLARRRRTTYTTENACIRDYLVGGLPPTGLRLSSTNLRYICQDYPTTTKTYFASLFDIIYGIPIYSAYVIKQAEAPLIGSFKREGIKWRTEPKGIPLQGSDATYAGNRLHDIGHLVPAEIYSFSQGNIESTFTYTNAVPQKKAFNRGKWSTCESQITEYAINTCSKFKGDLYLITGISEVTYGADLLPIKNVPMVRLGGAKGIIIPRSMWTAACCVHSTTKAVLDNFAVIGNNVNDKGKILLVPLSVKELEKYILVGVQGDGGPSISLFPGDPDCSAASPNKLWSKNICR